MRISLREFIRREIMKNPDYPLAFDEPLLTSHLIDSFALPEIAVFIESEFGVYVPDTDFSADVMDTVDAMASHVVGLGR